MLIDLANLIDRCYNQPKTCYPVIVTRFPLFSGGYFISLF